MTRLWRRLWRRLRTRTAGRQVRVTGAADVSEASAAAAAARLKLAEARARRPETTHAVNQFAAEVEAALARRRPR